MAINGGERIFKAEDMDPVGSLQRNRRERDYTFVGEERKKYEKVTADLMWTKERGIIDDEQFRFYKEFIRSGYKGLFSEDPMERLRSLEENLHYKMVFDFLGDMYSPNNVEDLAKKLQALKSKGQLEEREIDTLAGSMNRHGMVNGMDEGGNYEMALEILKTQEKISSKSIHYLVYAMAERYFREDDQEYADRVDRLLGIVKEKGGDLTEEDLKILIFGIEETKRGGKLPEQTENRMIEFMQTQGELGERALARLRRRERCWGLEGKDFINALDKIKLEGEIDIAIEKMVGEVYRLEGEDWDRAWQFIESLENKDEYHGERNSMGSKFFHTLRGGNEGFTGLKLDRILAFLRTTDCFDADRIHINYLDSSFSRVEDIPLFYKDETDAEKVREFFREALGR